MGVVNWIKGLRRGGREGPSSGTEPVSPERVPYHVAVIMDGNGRWAARRRLPVMAGHRAGTQALKRVIKAAVRLGVRQLTVYGFSTENWSRPSDEVGGLINLLDEMIDTEVGELHEQGVQIRFIGRREALGPALQAKMAEAEELTSRNVVMTLFIAFNYGGRSEIVDAARAAAADGVGPAEMDEATFAGYLYAPDMHDVDLVVRTSGELRLSNFLLWQSAYSEFYFTDILWPDFDEAAFEDAVREYESRHRRFGSRQAGDLV
jgi:undecaprenyl diphosphate synthase